jgi:chemotaxis protein MotB
MKKTIIYFIGLLLIASITVTCVSKKKYLRSVAYANKLKTDSMDTHNKLNTCNTDVKTLQNEKGNLQSENQEVINELQKVSTTSKMTIADQARRLKSLQDLIQQEKDAMNGLKQTISNALVNFKSDELSVYIKDGNVYVSMEEKLLFKSGSASVDPKGKTALEKVAGVLKTTPDVNVIIEGHTDNVPIKTAKFQDNWELSAARATAIVRILTDDGFDPNRITASGRGQYHPIQTNETAEGRQANRRTEIIISPNLTKLYNLLNQ